MDGFAVNNKLWNLILRSQKHKLPKRALIWAYSNLETVNVLIETMCEMECNGQVVPTAEQVHVLTQIDAEANLWLIGYGYKEDCR